ncbi:MAG: methyl-accepting chemotaxis protein [Gammaproteobacteria bacterium]|nr:methyl-accepting chemotaxis protein [Gammaproteobacteria bacterium]MBU2255001.1 methyl-accepting chemotaxis protein [Gammaproteobacteria bacterium]MBU2294740.1 methyl-accepting chemotaxis protein [Gammaproteobacteria bacterium]
MKFRSIQTTIATLAGASILAIVVALILYALYASGRSQELTQARTQDLLEQVIKQRLSALAQTQTLQIQAELEYPLMITAELANTNRLLGLKTEDGSAMLSMSREELNNLAREILVQHPKLLGSYIGWTVNGLDDSDAIYAGIGNPAVNESGRFIPWWYRNDDGSLAQELLTDLENEKPLPTGVRAGEYYLCPRDEKKACVIDPAPYEMGGKMVMLASFVSPILIDGTFKGMVGADLGVNFIQDLLVNADNQLYDGAGEMALISSHGRLVASTQAPDKLGSPATELLDANELENLRQLKPGQIIYDIHQEANPAESHIELFLSFGIGDTDARWTLMLVLPLNTVMAELQQLHGDLTNQRRADTLNMTLVGLLIAALGLLVIWLVSRGIAKPLRQMVSMLDDIAQGEGDLTRRLEVNRSDELGDIAKGFNTFLGKLQNMITQVVSSVQKVSDSSEHTADIAIRTNTGVQKQLAEIELVATAVHEMTATAQDVARNATHAAEAANHADRSANQGKQTVQHTADAIAALAQEIGRAVTVVQTLAKDSENINAILVAIRGIAEQTNLLALNAAIEAARAGEQGRGFAVVADEVRNLAQKTQKATEEIQAMIQQLQQGTRDVVKVMEDSQSKTAVSVQQASQAAEALESITQAVSVINDMNTQIASAAEEQSAVAEDINRNVTNIGQVANEVAGGADEASQASAELTKLAEQQRRLINQFRV